MNKRRAKKRLKKAYATMQKGRKEGISVLIKTQAYVNAHGQECDPLENPNGRFIVLKRPQIQYKKSDKKNIYAYTCYPKIDRDKSYIDMHDFLNNSNGQKLIVTDPIGGILGNSDMMKKLADNGWIIKEYTLN